MPINLKDNLYKNLPSIYKYEDSLASPDPFPLKRFLSVLGDGGFNELESYIKDIENLYDVDNNNDIFLPYLSEMFGIKFPFDAGMDVALQRNILKILPILYKLKGTEDSFNYLSRELFGYGSKAETYTKTYAEMLPEEVWAIERTKIFVRLEANGEDDYVAQHINSFGDRYIHYAEIIRPANKHIITHLALIYNDIFDIYSRYMESLGQSVSQTQQDNYMKVIAEVIIPDMLKNTYDETFNFAGVMEETLYLVTTLPVLDTYLTTVTEENTGTINLSITETVPTAKVDSFASTGVTYTRMATRLNSNHLNIDFILNNAQTQLSVNY